MGSGVCLFDTVEALLKARDPHFFTVSLQTKIPPKRLEKK